VLEASVTRAGRVAGMLLADLGADVVRAVVAPTGVPGQEPESTFGAMPDELPTPEALLWDRGKRLVRMTGGDVARLAAGADVLLVDRAPARLRVLGLDAASLGHPTLNHVWLPPYGARGEWAELAEDPLLLAAVGGLSARYPATRDVPVAPVSAVTTQFHGTLGAAAAVAALIGRDRGDGRGRAVTVSGLHAISATLGTMNQVGHDRPVLRGGRSGKGVPFWRIYQAGDGRWLYLAALVPETFIRALDAMGRIDILVMPGVDGEFNNIRVWDQGGHLVAAALEDEFRRRPLAEWLEVFAAADIPCAPISTRAEWAGGDIVAANRAFVDRDHPVLGPVRMPGFPVDLPGMPARPGGFSDIEDLPAAGALWRDTRSRQPSDGGGAEPLPELPLRGVTVVDLSSFLAGPLIGTIMADWGADVVKIEPPAGDPYRNYPVSVLVSNQHKRALALDLAKPGGADVLLRLLRHADVFVENMRPGRLEKLGLSDARIAAARPDLVRCSVSAYGAASAYADAPGFDPVFQALSGLADAQGGDGEPVLAPVPINDIGTGALGVLSALAALYARDRSGGGHHLYLSLANTATFLQGPEFTAVAGRQDPVRGATDFPGPAPEHRFYPCSDGWVALAADGPARLGALLELLGLPPSGDGAALAAGIAAALEGRTVAEAVASLRSRGIPAARVVMGEAHATDEHLLANDFQHDVVDPRFGRIGIVRAYADWDGADGPGTPRAVLVGHDTRAVLADAGYGADEVESLLAAGVAADIDLSDVPEEGLPAVAPPRSAAHA
jgi:crotonobetainyl-CoA:carnitine CoA-transferase CaiB-like acyl-CoA transferase